MGTGVPMEITMSHTWGIGCYWTLARVADLAEESVETGDTVGIVLLGDIPLACQGRVTIPTAEVMHVPRSAFCLGVLPGKDDLITGRASRIEDISIMTFTVDSPFLTKVDHVHQKFPASEADETTRMPTFSRHFTGNDGWPATFHFLLTTVTTHNGP